MIVEPTGIRAMKNHPNSFLKEPYLYTNPKKTYASYENTTHSENFMVLLGIHQRYTRDPTKRAFWHEYIFLFLSRSLVFHGLQLFPFLSSVLFYVSGFRVFSFAFLVFHCFLWFSLKNYLIALVLFICYHLLLFICFGFIWFFPVLHVSSQHFMERRHAFPLSWGLDVSRAAGGCGGHSSH